MAQLAPVVDDLKDVAEPVRQFYVQKDGKYHVDLAGAPAGFVSAADLAAANAKVVEFRDNNVNLKKQVDELLPLKDRYKDLDPDAARAALAAQEELKKKGITKPDDLTALRTSMLEDIKKTLVEPLQQQLQTITTTAQEERKRADALTLRSVLGEAFTKAGGQSGAAEFIASKASGVFKVVDGKVVAEANQYSTDRPGEPLSLDEWMTRMTKENAFAFKPSSGSGADPAKGGGGGGNKPGVLVINNPTPQQLGQYGDDARKGKVKFTYDAK